MNTHCRPLSSGKRFVEQIFFTQSDVGLRSLGIVIDFGNQTWRMHHFFSRWVSLPQSYEHSSSFPLTTDSVNTESPTLCTIDRAGCYAKRKLRSAFFREPQNCSIITTTRTPQDKYSTWGTVTYESTSL